MVRIAGISPSIVLSGVLIARGSILTAQMSDAGNAREIKEARHELVMPPYYGVFDNLAYRVAGLPLHPWAK